MESVNATLDALQIIQIARESIEVSVIRAILWRVSYVLEADVKRMLTGGQGH